MKKIITFILSAMAISLGLSAQETSLRDQLVGLYGGSAQGGDYSIAPDYGWNELKFDYNTDGYPPVRISAGEADNQVVIEDFFPAMDGFEEDGMVGTVTETSDYEGWLGYISLDTQVVGKYKGKDVTLYNMDYSWALTTNTIELWITSDGALSMGTYATLRYPGSEYDMYLCYVYADLNKKVATADDINLAESLVGIYDGAAQGYEYLTNLDGSTYFTFNYNTDEYPAVTVEAGDVDNQVEISGLFQADSRIVYKNLVGTVYATSEYTGIKGYILVSDHNAGTFTHPEQGEKQLTLSTSDWNYVMDSESDYCFWIYDDGAIETNYYATLTYPYDFNGNTYTYYADILYAKINRIGDLPVDYTEADVALAKQLEKQYKGDAQGGDYSVAPDYGWQALQFSYDTDGYPAVEITADDEDNTIEIANFFPTNANFYQEPLIGVVTATSDYEGWLGYITLYTQPVGYFNDQVVTLYNMSYEWALTTDPIELWITSDGALSMGTYATLRYPGEEYDMYLYYIYASLTPIEGGINAIAADSANNNAPVEFFNINGMRVSAANLAPGLYIRRQGNEVSKVIIK